MSLLFLHRFIRFLTCAFFLSLFLVELPVSAATISTIVGTGNIEDSGQQGPALSMNVGQPFGVEVGPDGALYITEVANHRVRRLDLSQGILTTVAGNGKKGYSGDGGPATQASLNEPYEVRFDSAGNMYFVEMQNHLIRRVDAKTKIISTIAGTGQAGFSGDGEPANRATFKQPHSIAFDRHDNLYIADIGNHRIRRIEMKRGTIESIAGNGDRRRLPQDGQLAKDNPIAGPRALFIEGNTMWIALREGHSVWRYEITTGKLFHVAGTGKKGFSGDQGDAKKATFNGPKGIAVGPDKNVYVVDTENQVIRKIDLKTGFITTVAGSGPESRGFAGDGGPAISAQLDRPHGICVDSLGRIYLGDTLNHRVRYLKPPR